MKSIQISVFHLVLLSMTVIGLKNHVTIIPALLQESGRDGWMSVGIAAISLFPWLFILIYIHRASKGQNLIDWLEQIVGSTLANIIKYSVIIYCLLLASFTMHETLLWVTTTFLFATPLLYLLLIFCCLLLYFVTTTMYTIVIVNAIVLFGVVVFGFFVAIVNIQVKDYELLRPFFEHGLEPIFLGALYPASGYMELLLLLFLQHHVKDEIKLRHWVIMLLLLTGLTLGPLIGAITEFGPHEAAKQSYPAYEEWGLATIGRFVEHIDFFSIYQWLTGTFIRAGIFLYIIVDLCKMTEQKKNIWQFIGPPFVVINLLFGLMNDELFYRWNEKYFLLVTVGFFILLSLLLTFVAFMSNRRTKKR